MNVVLPSHFFFLLPARPRRKSAARTRPVKGTTRSAGDNRGVIPRALLHASAQNRLSIDYPTRAVRSR